MQLSDQGTVTPNFGSPTTGKVPLKRDLYYYLTAGRTRFDSWSYKFICRQNILVEQVTVR
jgi:hypothetical protein